MLKIFLLFIFCVLKIKKNTMSIDRLKNQSFFLVLFFSINSISLSSVYANDDSGDYCVYVDATSPYFNPNKLTDNQLEECKIRAQKILEIQAIQIEIQKNRYLAQNQNRSILPKDLSANTALQNEIKAYTLPKNQSEQQAINPPKTVNNTGVNTNKKISANTNTNTNTNTKQASGKQPKKQTESIVKPLYHADAGAAVDFENTQIILTKAGDAFDNQTEQTTHNTTTQNSTTNNALKSTTDTQNNAVEAILAASKGVSYERKEMTEHTDTAENPINANSELSPENITNNQNLSAASNSNTNSQIDNSTNPEHTNNMTNNENSIQHSSSIEHVDLPAFGDETPITLNEQSNDSEESSTLKLIQSLKQNEIPAMLNQNKKDLSESLDSIQPSDTVSPEHGTIPAFREENNTIPTNQIDPVPSI